MHTVQERTIQGLGIPGRIKLQGFGRKSLSLKAHIPSMAEHVSHVSKMSLGAI